ncbi:MAG: DUF4271 domain-containing protein [Bacteroidota bacterium]
MKQVLFYAFLLVFPALVFSQQPDTSKLRPDSVRLTIDSVQLKQDSVMPAKIDSQAIKKLIRDSVAGAHRNNYLSSWNRLLKENQYLNSQAKAVAMPAHPRQSIPDDNVFYLLLIIIALLGFLRFFYTRYFNNLFRVFFNASLRQSQLTDQLLQAKLPSLLFNIFFVLAGGVYVYLLLRHYNWITAENFWLVVLYCGVSLGLVYFVKFISLKFTGWVTGFKEITNTYVFVIFLINKILSIVLLPLIVMMAFSISTLATVAVMISLLLVGLMFLLRFFRSYGLLQHQLKISKFHFFMYVIGIEVIPLLLIYKGLVLLLSKNL